MTSTPTPETPEVARCAPNITTPAPEDTPIKNGPQNGAQPRDHRHPRCPRCGIIWHQAGNRTGHCSACHRTFDSAAAFDRHRRDGACLDTLTLTDAEGHPVFGRRKVYDEDHADYGTTYWRLIPSPAQSAWLEQQRAMREATS